MTELVDYFPECKKWRVGRTKSPIVSIEASKDDIVLIVKKEDGTVYATCDNPSNFKAGSFKRLK